MPVSAPIFPPIFPLASRGPCFVGIDIAKARFDAHVHCPDVPTPRQTAQRLELPCNPQGYDKPGCLRVYEPVR